MPNRLIREGFLDSEAIHALSDAAECFYHRLLLACDDAGRMDGRVEILRARLFPLDSHRKSSDVERDLTECVTHGLVIPYVRDGKRFLQLAKWQRCSPCATSRHPWQDGTHKIVYVKRETRDGEKDFVATSLIPYGRDTDGIGIAASRMYGDGDGDGDVVEDVCAEAPAPSAPKKRAGRAKASGITFAAYLADCEAKDVPAIPPTAAVFTYAEKVGLPDGFVPLAWRWFKKTYGEGGDRAAKTYSDWQKVFYNAVEGDWAGYFRVSGDGQFYLSQKGKQAELEASR